MGIRGFFGISAPGSASSESDDALEEQIQQILDTQYAGWRESGRKTDDIEAELRAKGILPEGWRLRDSGTASGYRPTRAATKKMGAIRAGAIAGSAVGGAAALGAFGGGGAAASGGTGALGGVGGSTAGTGGLLAATPGLGVGTTALGALPAGLSSGAVAGGLATGLAAPGAAALGGGGMNWLGLAQRTFDYKNPQSYMDLADRLGAVSQGRAQGRQAEAMNQMALARLLLGQAEFNRGAPGARGRNAVFGDLLSGLQPAKLTGEGRNLSVGGGLTPALLSPETRQIGSSIRRQALLSQLGQGGADDLYTFNQKTAAPMPEEGTLDKILSYAGLAGGLLGGGGR